MATPARPLPNNKKHLVEDAESRIEKALAMLRSQERAITTNNPVLTDNYRLRAIDELSKALNDLAKCLGKLNP